MNADMNKPFEGRTAPRRVSGSHTIQSPFRSLFFSSPSTPDTPDSDTTVPLPPELVAEQAQMLRRQISQSENGGSPLTTQYLARMDPELVATQAQMFRWQISQSENGGSSPSTQYLARMEHLLREEIRLYEQRISCLRATVPEDLDTIPCMTSCPLRTLIYGRYEHDPAQEVRSTKEQISLIERHISVLKAGLD
jgi:transcriptional regulator with XRE-family HTH domain